MPDAKTIETEMAYVVGASMLVRRSFLEQVGLLNEEYFLYFEELDWAIRALGRFTLAYSPLSVVYHKEGRSIGSSSRREERSSASERYAARNRIIITKKYFPAVLPIVVSAVTVSAIHRLLTGSILAASVIAQSLLDGCRYSTTSKFDPR
jgi:GT2 family glycosyltransferase